MFKKYKMYILNYLIMITLFFLIGLFENSLLPGIFGPLFPICLWMPFLIYWTMYRKIGEAIFMIYFITFSLASLSSLHISYLLVFHSLVLLTLILLKKFYYISWVFFTLAVAGAVFSFPLVLYILQTTMGEKVAFPNVLFWFVGGVIAWLFSFPLLSLVKWIDFRTILPPRHKQ